MLARFRPRLTPTRGTVVLVVAAAAASLVWAAQRAAAAPQGGSELSVAARLARQVVAARKPGAEYRALLAVMRALNVAVVTPKGRLVVRGRSGGVTSVYLYDFEVRLLAGRLVRHERSSTREIAGTLSSQGVRSRRVPLRATVLSAAIRRGVAAALRHPRDPYSLAPLLLREISLRHGGRFPPAHGALGARSWDALQQFLIEGDVLGRLIRTRSGHRAHHPTAGRPKLGSARAARTTPAVRASAGGCRGLQKNNTYSDYSSLGQWIVKQIPFVSDALKGVAIPLVQLQVELLQKLIHARVASDNSTLSARYGPPANAAPEGTQLDFVIEVSADYPGDAKQFKDAIDEAIACGSLTGIKLPKPGPQEDVSVDWNPLIAAGMGGSLATLTKHGHITREDKRTHSDGKALLQFVTKDEVLPGYGQLTTAEGVVSPRVNYVTAFSGDKLALVPQLLAPLLARFDWQITYHAQWAFDTTLGGTQKTSTTFTSTQAPYGSCDGYTSTESGSQSLSFETSAAVRIVAYQDQSGTWRVAIPPNPFSAMFQMPGTIMRPTATTSTFTDNGGGSGLCGGGGGGGPPPTPDCGNKPVTFREYFEMPSVLDVKGNGTTAGDPYAHCPGPVSKFGDDEVAPIPLDLTPAQIKDEETPSYQLGATTVYPENESSSSGGSSTNVTGSTTLHWHATLDRVP